jgi:hypothetical protein
MRRHTQLTLLAAASASAWLCTRWFLARRSDHASEEEEKDAVNVASDDSFPASDPPSYTPTGGGQTGQW